MRFKEGSQVKTKNVFDPAAQNREGSVVKVRQSVYYPRSVVYDVKLKGKSGLFTFGPKQLIGKR